MAPSEPKPLDDGQTGDQYDDWGVGPSSSQPYTMNDPSLSPSTPTPSTPTPPTATTMALDRARGPHGKPSALEMLPEELIQMIVDELEPPRSGQWDSKRDLLNLSRMSKKLLRVAQPAIFHNVVIRDEEDLVILLSTLRITLADFIKTLDIWPLKWPQLNADFNYTMSIFRSSDPELYRIPDVDLEEAVEIHGDLLFVGKLCAKLLCIWTLNLTSLRVNPLPIAFARMFGECIKLNRTGAPGRNNNPRLSTLEIREDPWLQGPNQLLYRELYAMPSIRKIVFQVKRHRAGVVLRRLEAPEYTWGDGSFGTSLTNIDGPRQYPHVKSIELRDSIRVPFESSGFGHSFPNLQSLSFIGEMTQHPWENELHVDDWYLSMQLAHITKLRNLHLELDPRNCRLGWDTNRYLGHDACLRLVRLRELETLRVPLHFLVTNQVRFDATRTYFPPSLKKLTLDFNLRSFWLLMERSGRWAPSEWALKVDHMIKMIVDFVHRMLTEGIFPLLEEVKIVWNNSWHVYEGLLMDIPLENLADLALIWPTQSYMLVKRSPSGDIPVQAKHKFEEQFVAGGVVRTMIPQAAANIKLTVLVDYSQLRGWPQIHRDT